MDRIQETANILVELNRFKKGQIQDFELIKSVCSFFDLIKNDKLYNCDYKFLRYVANCSGIPHFYDILSHFGQNPNIDSFDLNTFSSVFYESILHTDEVSMLHRFQKKILDKFDTGKPNRYLLSASTSFGKTHIVFEILKKMNYSNAVLVFPTIALLSENLEKIISDDRYSYFRNKYKIHTLSEVKELGESNLFIYTPERLLSFIEKNKSGFLFDFAFVDEVYKIDNDYLIDEEVKENERDVAYRLAAHYSLEGKTDVLFAGPYMEFSENEASNYNSSFDNFLKDKSISLLNYNEYEIVNKSYFEIKRLKSFPEDKSFNLVLNNTKKTDNLVETTKSILNISQNLIVYCANRGKNGGVEYYAESLIDSEILKHHDYSQYSDLISHISSNFTDKWILLRALRNGIGIHHGLVPKYIQKEIINLFNTGLIKVLISTTTITEGVNTSAKNLVVMHSKKGSKDLKKFDAKNIAGRAGRFGFHYSGRVIDLSNSFLKVIESEAIGIRHKNYDAGSPKDEIDLFYSKDEYLSDADKARKSHISTEQLLRNIPDNILNQYKVVSRLDKIKVYDEIAKLTSDEFEEINKLIRVINYKLDVDYNGFQVVLNVIQPIVKNQKLRFLIEYKGESGNYSMLTNLIHFYLIGGFKSSIAYHVGKGESIDEAIKKTSEFVYNTLKYQVVKYLGVFNLMYKFYLSQKQNKSFDEVSGIDTLLLKFEYNALTDEDRLASDYGVPSSVVEYYENVTKMNEIKKGFDNYELKSFEKIQALINKNK